MEKLYIVDSSIVGSPQTHKAFNLLLATAPLLSLETNKQRTACVLHLFSPIIKYLVPLHFTVYYRRAFIKKVPHMVRAMGSAPAVPHIACNALNKRFARKPRARNRLVPTPQAYNPNNQYRKPVLIFWVCNPLTKKKRGLNRGRLSIMRTV